VGFRGELGKVRKLPSTVLVRLCLSSEHWEIIAVVKPSLVYLMVTSISSEFAPRSALLVYIHTYRKDKAV
jgi:hypothetical protein